MTTQDTTTDSLINEELLKTIGLSGLQEDLRNDLLSDVGEVVFRSVLRRVWNSLGAHEKHDLLEILDQCNARAEQTGSCKELDMFMQTKVPELERYVREEVADINKTQQTFYTEITS